MVESLDVTVGSQASNATANGGIIETIKESINPQAVVQKLKVSQAQLIDMGLYAAIGFLLGFFIKRYATYVIAFGLFATGIILLSQFNMLSLHINWSEVYQTLNIPVAAGVGMDNVAAIAWEWARSNILASSSFVVGLLIGLKVG